MFAWQDTPSPVTSPAYVMHSPPVKAATRPAASTTATWRPWAKLSAATSCSSALGASTPARQQVEQPWTVGGVGVGLGCDRANPGTRPGNDRPDREPVRLDGNAELT